MSSIAVACVVAGCTINAEPESENVDSDDVVLEETYEGPTDTAEQALISTLSNVPFYSEFNTVENPNSYYWCAHAAFKVVYKYKTGKYISLQTIDQLLTQKYGNYSTCGSLKCSSEDQIGEVAKMLGLSNSYVYLVSSMANFFAKVKDGVNYNYPPIVGSYMDYASAGHYWVIVGYNDTGDINTSTIYLRNVALKSAAGTNYDKIVTVPKFYASTRLKNGVYSTFYVDKMLFVKP